MKLNSGKVSVCKKAPVAFLYFLGIVVGFVVCARGAPGAESSAEQLIAGLGKKAAVMDNSEGRLVKMGPGIIPLLLEALDNIRKRDAVVRVFNRMGCDAAPGLVKLLENDEARTKAGSMLFQAVSPDCVKQIGAYLACMDNAAFGHYCGTALVRTSGPKAKSWLPELKKRMTAGDADSRAYVIAAIGEMGKKASSAAADLIAALKDPAPIARLSAVVAIRKTGVKSQAVRDALAAAAVDADGEVRREAGELLKTLANSE